VTTVAEGVEDAETAITLRGYGCEVAQGYCYSPPLSPTATLELLSARPSELAPASALRTG
jgi:diguanylate cyclase